VATLLIIKYREGGDFIGPRLLVKDEIGVASIEFSFLFLEGSGLPFSSLCDSDTDTESV
jgi:hypothetical protein